MCSGFPVLFTAGFMYLHLYCSPQFFDHRIVCWIQQGHLNMRVWLCLQVYSREVWRSSISNRSYDRQCDKILWGLESHVKKEEKDVSP
jgi:hypothetical protein